MSRSGRKPKSPAFQFYPGDFLADTKVQAMRTEEVGAYLLLLCAEWLDGPLPDDPRFLARVCRLDPAAFAQAWESIGRCFRPVDGRPGYLENSRLERERAFQAEGRERRLEASKKANEVRHGSESEPNRSPIGGQPVSDWGPPLSPTPHTPTPTPETRSPASRKCAPRATRAEPTGDHAEAIRFFEAQFLAETGAAYAFEGAKDGEHVRVLLSRGGLPEFQARARTFFADKWHRETGLTISKFRTAWNNLVVAKPPPPPAPRLYTDAEEIRAKREAARQRQAAERAADQKAREA